MSTPRWARVWELEIEAQRWRLIANALDILEEDYEVKNGIEAKTDITRYGISIQIEVEGQISVDFLKPCEVAQISPEAYEFLRQAKAVGDYMDRALKGYR